MASYNNKKIDNCYLALSTWLELIPAAIFCVLLWAGSEYDAISLYFCALMIFAIYVFDSFFFRTCYIICWLDELSQAVTERIFYKDLKIAELTNRMQMQSNQLEELTSEHEQLLTQYNENTTKLEQIRTKIQEQIQEYENFCTGMECGYGVEHAELLEDERVYRE